MNKRQKLSLRIRFINAVLKVFTRKVKSVGIENIKEPSLILANHSGSKGPIRICMNFPYQFKTLIRGDLCDGLISAYKAAYNFRRERCHNNKLVSFLFAFFVSPFGYFLSHAKEAVPSYKDMRFQITVNKAKEEIENGGCVIIFGDSQSSDCINHDNKPLPGFIYIANYIYQSGKNIPIVCSFYDMTHNIITYSKSVYIKDLFDKGLSIEDIQQYFGDLFETLQLK